MNYTKLFYWLTVADGLKNALDTFSNIFTWVFALSGLLYIGCCIGKSAAIGSTSIENEKSDKDVRAWENMLKYTSKIFYTSLFLSITLWLTWALIPIKKDALLIVAGGSTMNFLTQDSTAKQLPHELSSYLVTEIRNMAEETKVELSINDNKQKILDEAKQLTSEQLIEKLKTDSTLKNILINQK